MRSDSCGTSQSIYSRLAWWKSYFLSRTYLRFCTKWPLSLRLSCLGSRLRSRKDSGRSLKLAKSSKCGLISLWCTKVNFQSCTKLTTNSDKRSSNQSQTSFAFASLNGISAGTSHWSPFLSLTLKSSKCINMKVQPISAKRVSWGTSLAKSW